MRIVAAQAVTVDERLVEVGTPDLGPQQRAANTADDCVRHELVLADAIHHGELLQSAHRQLHEACFEEGQSYVLIVVSAPVDGMPGPAQSPRRQEAR